MASNALQICNNALMKLGLTPILGFDERTPHADVIRQAYPQARDYVLAQHIWHFARKSIALATVKDVPTGRWTYAYQLPADHGRTLSFVNTYGDRVPFERVGKFLFSDVELPTLFYIRSYGPALDDQTAFPPEFTEALACYLAANLAVVLIRDMNMRASLFEQYGATITQARHNGCADTYNGPEVSLWVDQRIVDPNPAASRPITPTDDRDAWADFV